MTLSHHSTSTLQFFWWPTLKTHSQTQAHFSKQLFDFFERLTAKVLRLEHFAFGFLNQIADVFDVCCLQTILGTNTQIKLVHRTQQVLIELVFRWLLFLDFELFFFFKVDEDRQLLF